MNAEPLVSTTIGRPPTASALPRTGAVRALSAGCLGALLAACTTMYGGAVAPTKVSDGILTDPAGMSLYTFDSDPAGKSVCNGACATNWPPLAAPADARAMGDYSVVVRDDGSRQWAYRGKPLYRWVKDGKPGDRTGDGFRNVWHLARP